jgi:hypothetical protein
MFPKECAHFITEQYRKALFSFFEDASEILFGFPYVFTDDGRKFTFYRSSLSSFVII